MDRTKRGSWLDEIGMDGFPMRVAVRDAPSRIDEARPDDPPNEDDDADGRQRATALPPVRRQQAARARAGRSPSLDETVQCDRVQMAGRVGVPAGDLAVRNRPRKGGGRRAAA